MDERIIINTPSDVERSAPDGPVTRRNLYTNTAQNKNIPSKLQAVVDDTFQGQTSFESLIQFKDQEELHKAISQLIIRFDTKPDYYTKKDYQLLIAVLTGGLNFLDTQCNNNIPDLSDIYAKIQILEDKLNTVSSDLADFERDATLILNQIILDLHTVSAVTIPQIQTDLLNLTQVVNSVQNQSNQNTSDIVNLDFRVSQLEANQNQQYLVEGSGIDITNDVVSAVSTETFTVSNVNIGGYTDGMVITEDTPILEILKTILQKVVDVKATAPIAKLTGTAYKAEFGAKTTSSATIKLTQGYFDSVDSSWNSGKQYMDCKISGINDDWNWVIADDGMSAMTLNEYVADKYQKFSVDGVTITQNTVIPKKSNNEDSTVQYTKTTLPVSGSIEVIPYYNIYFGPISTTDINTVTSTDVRVLENVIKAEFPISAKTSSGEYEGKGQSILIACPSEYKLDGIVSSVGLDLMLNFSQTTTLNVVCGGGTEVPYTLYLYPISNGANQAYKNLIFKLV